MREAQGLFLPRSAVHCAWLCLALTGAGQVQAATVTADVDVALPVNAPTCTLTNSGTSIQLPSATSPSQTIGSYMTPFAESSITNPALGKSMVSLHQVATISCTTTAPVPLTRFVVKPGPGAVLFIGNGTQDALQYLVDQSSPPVIAGAAGNFQIWFEQLEVNGTATPFSYRTAVGVVNPYLTTFNTSGGATNQATVAWRPVLYRDSGKDSVIIGAPTTGTAFTASAVISVDY